ncbi:hypothetical protein [Oligoflexus tunisiensis]|uniref:hypothetical protein n=1 Tax=Oligoflexus tunisiensis TaxID=708132 RepID=UPI00114CD31E|nr:hypothetical protein [Oligoflexus tunisiensis]
MSKVIAVFGLLASYASVQAESRWDRIEVSQDFINEIGDNESNRPKVDIDIKVDIEPQGKQHKETFYRYKFGLRDPLWPEDQVTC